MRASQTIDGSMTGKKFLAYVERCLAPTLKRKDIVMIDNLPAHKAAGVREAIEARGATLQLRCGIYVRPKQRKMVLKELPRVRAGYGATFASRLRSSR
jgi:transposase